MASADATNLKIVTKNFGVLDSHKLSVYTQRGGMQAFRQALTAGVRWGYVASNPAAAVGPNPQPTTIERVPFTLAEVEAIAAAPASRPG